MHARTVEIEHARGIATPAAGAIVFDFVAKVHPDTVPFPPQTKTEIHIGLTLPIPRIKSTDRMERFHVDQRAAGVDGFYWHDPAVLWPALRLFPQLLPAREKLVPCGENPRRHQRLLVRCLLCPCKTDL